MQKHLDNKTRSQIVISPKTWREDMPANTVWKDANFSIGQGEFVAVLGPNGAGKTTLFRMLLGLAQPLGGTLTIFGKAPRRGNPRIGYVPQRHPIDDETGVEALELVRLGLTEIIGERVRRSRGSKKRSRSFVPSARKNWRTAARRALGRGIAADISR